MSDSLSQRQKVCAGQKTDRSLSTTHFSHKKEADMATNNTHAPCAATLFTIIMNRQEGKAA